MKGLSLSSLLKIVDLIDEHFDKVGSEFLGLIPKYQGQKLVLTTNPDSVVSLFLQALETTDPTKTEEDTLKSLLVIADSYVEALKERTKAQTLQDINSYIADQKSQKKAINTRKVKEIFQQHMDKAQNHFGLIAGAET